MAKDIKIKTSSFGTISVDHFSPPPSAAAPKALNIHISFEEALKLGLGLQQILLKLNTYNRSTTAGKAACVNLCVFTDLHSVTVNEGKLGARKAGAPASKSAPVGLETSLKEYIAEVNATNLEQTTKHTYIQHATSFVRWTKGGFKPGERK